MKKALVVFLTVIVLAGCPILKMSFEEMKDTCPVQLEFGSVDQPDGYTPMFYVTLYNETNKPIEGVTVKIFTQYTDGEEEIYWWQADFPDTIWGDGQISEMIELDTTRPIALLEARSYVTDISFTNGTSWHASDYWEE